MFEASPQKLPQERKGEPDYWVDPADMSQLELDDAPADIAAPRGPETAAAQSAPARPSLLARICFRGLPLEFPSDPEAVRRRGRYSAEEICSEEVEEQYKIRARRILSLSYFLTLALAPASFGAVYLSGSIAAGFAFGVFSALALGAVSANMCLPFLSQPALADAWRRRHDGMIADQTRANLIALTRSLSTAMTDLSAKAQAGCVDLDMLLDLRSRAGELLEYVKSRESELLGPGIESSALDPGAPARVRQAAAEILKNIELESARSLRRLNLEPFTWPAG